MNEIKDNRKFNGGARANAGRKPGKKKITVSFSIEEEVIISARQKYKGKLSSLVEKYLMSISE
jgi:hypothetical protein